MPFDFPILYFIQDHIVSPILNPVMIFTSATGEFGILWFIIAISMLFFKKTRKWGVAIICAMALAFVAGELIIKNIVCRVRPCNQDFAVQMLIEKPIGYSFPSSHSATSFAVATVIFAKYKKLGALALLYAGVIAFSRMYLFVHFPSDVAVGALLGIVSGIIILAIYKKYFIEETKI